MHRTNAEMTRTERLRVAKGWSQGQMADYLGLTQSQISRIETSVSGESGSVSRLLDLLELYVAETSLDRAADTTGERS